MKLPNQESITTLGGKESLKYLEILKSNTIKQAEMKEKLEKSTSEERESFLKSNSAEEISSKK